ncbi:GNAT family N-acetyltransferase [Sphingomonas sp.]|uniref:GNAT family N-acetyltransferase n=1 Tax=Sphingomonas sp. TaxID=28214 RepID=UPI001B1A6039|nr:GNAT family N-acetyltransferase [Sphingomonas sp.]MBO9711987.1 GNAT family N-acetyltransferase [Sphingomonas sp.]
MSDGTDPNDVAGETIAYRRWAAPIAEAAAVLLPLCRAAFGEFDDAYLTDRLRGLEDPDLWLAESAGGAVGFKLGYRRGAALLYSWLGGVAPEARRHGVASALMKRQHAGALAQGFRFVETRTRSANNAMLILNLRHGFRVVGHEIDARGIPVVTLRKDLQ